jgi:hypothetical protein
VFFFLEIGPFFSPPTRSRDADGRVRLSILSPSLTTLFIAYLVPRARARLRIAITLATAFHRVRRRR